MYYFPHQELFCSFLGGGGGGLESSPDELTPVCVHVKYDLLFYLPGHLLNPLRPSGCPSDSSTCIYLENTREAKWVILVAVPPKGRGNIGHGTYEHVSTWHVMVLGRLYNPESEQPAEMPERGAP